MFQFLMLAEVKTRKLVIVTITDLLAQLLMLFVFSVLILKSIMSTIKNILNLLGFL